MAWRSSGATNKALVNNLQRNGVIENDRVSQAMLGVRLPRSPVYSAKYCYFVLLEPCIDMTGLI
jgi:hypothetical protein